jgi:putative DNA primase/helicase
VHPFTRGASWPCDEGRAPSGDVVIIQQEDDENDTLAPRLKVAGADMSRVRIVGMVRKTDGSGERVFNIANDLPMLERLLESFNNPVMLAIDPLQVYVGKLNAAAGTEVRSTLMPLVDLLKRFHVLGLGVMHFNKKVDINNALVRVSDSMAFGAVARHCFVVTNDPANDRKLPIKAKNNLWTDVKALSYHTDEVVADRDHDIKAPRIAWDEHVEINPADAMQAEAGGFAASTPRKEAKDLLTKHLAGGGVPQKEIEDIIVGGEGITKMTLNRAKRDLGIISKKGKGVNDGWIWYLPEHAPKDAAVDGF